MSCTCPLCPHRLLEAMPQPVAAEAPALMRPAQAAEYLAMSESWLRQLAAEDKVPHRYLDERLLFVRAELDAWMLALPQQRRRRSAGAA